MSVLKDMRAISKAEFVNTAGEIFDETVAFLSRLSARYSRLLAEKTADLAGEVMDEAEKANSLYPSSLLRIDRREAHLLEARAALMALDVRLGRCYRLMMKNPQGAFTNSAGQYLPPKKAEEKLDNMAQKLGELVDKENDLLKGALDYVAKKRRELKK